jgi:hypothetical protein
MGMTQRMLVLSFALCTLAAGAAVPLLAGEAKEQAAPRLVGISMAVPDPESKFDMSLVFGRSAGTQLTFRAVRPDAVILGIDDDASKLLAFTDDKGADLAGERWLGNFPHISDDKHAVVFEVQSKRLPSAGARELRVQAEIAVKVGSDPQVAEVKDLALSAGQRVAIGPVPFKLAKVGKPDFGDDAMTVDLVSERDLDAVSAMEFVAPDGRVIDSRVISSMSFSMGGKGTFTRTVALKEKVATATLRLRWFAKVAATPLRIDSKIGVGF